MVFVRNVKIEKISKRIYSANCSEAISTNIPFYFQEPIFYRLFIRLIILLKLMQFCEKYSKIS